MEAEILHQIDNIDASMQMMLTSIRQTEPGKYTDRIFGMDNQKFLCTKKIYSKNLFFFIQNKKARHKSSLFCFLLF